MKKRLQKKLEIVAPKDYNVDSIRAINSIVNEVVHEVICDSWTNQVTGQGGALDKNQYFGFKPEDLLNEGLGNYLYEHDPISHRIIELMTREVCKKDFIVKGDVDMLCLKEFERLNVQKKFSDLTTWAYLHGGAVGLMMIDDGREIDEPVDWANVRSLRAIHVFDRWRCMNMSADLVSDPMSSRYNQPEWYNIYPMGVVFSSIDDYDRYKQKTRKTKSGWGVINLNQKNKTLSFRAHWTRVLRFDAPETPYVDKIRNMYWNHSYLQSCLTALRAIGSGYGNISTIIQEFVLSTLKLQGTLQKIAAAAGSTKGNTEVESLKAGLKARLQEFAVSKSITNLNVIDEKEDFKRESITVSGLRELFIELRMWVCAATNIPNYKLFSDTTTGLSAKDESSERAFASFIEAEKKRMWAGPARQISEIIMLQKEGPFKGKIIEDFGISFEPLWTETRLEDVQAKKIQSEIDQNYVNMSSNPALLEKVILKSRFGGNEFSYDIDANDEDLKKFLEEEPMPEMPKDEPKQVTKEEPKKTKSKKAPKDE